MTSEQTEVGAARLVRGDVLQWAAEYQGEPFHAMLCDPPYHLTDVHTGGVAIPGKFGQRTDEQKAARRAARKAGFMNQRWDGGDLAFRPETWAALSKHLHPGAFCMAFAGTRGYHRMAVAIEAAGFILHPLIAYIFGSGFPKATRIPDGRFDGHRYGLQSLKPALEPICVFQKPYKGKPVDSITRTGAGALNIAGGRIGTAAVRPNGGSKFPNLYGKYAECPESEREGRWPSNLLLDDSSAAALDQMSGVSTSTGGTNPTVGTFACLEGGKGGRTPFHYQDTGGASRFFFQSEWNAETLERLDDALPFFYCAKAGRGEREAGLEGFALGDNGQQYGTIQNTPNPPMRNPHPCLKPLKLTKFLSSLLLPPADYAPRRLLVPFSGVASEMCGALLAGWEHVTGIEGEAEYCEIAAARLKFWQCNSGLFESLTADDGEEPPEQYGFGFEEEAS